MYIVYIYRFFRCQGSNIAALPGRNLNDASMQLANSWFRLFVYCLANKLTRPILKLQAMLHEMRATPELDGFHPAPKRPDFYSLKNSPTV